MTDIYKAPYGSYATPAAVTTACRATLNTTLTNLANLIPDSTTGVAITYMTDWDKIPPQQCKFLHDEINAILVGINAAPTATAGT